MKIKILIAITIGLLFTTSGFGQNQEKYSEFVKEAWSLYESKDYKQSAKKYKAAFDELDGKAYPNDRYNAACSYALANDIENSFYHLFYLAENSKIKYKNLSHISTDTDLDTLHSDDRWSELIKIVEANKQEYEKDFDKPLVAKLDTIYQLDQNYRRQISDIEEKYGRESEEMEAHWKLIQKTDSINLVKIKKILDERGWLGPKVIGNQGNSTLFLVIQHADLETQQKYLPMMREAVKLGNASASSLALLEDRVALRQGKRQIYGSQIGRDPETGEYYVSPLIEPEKVNERRAEVGLGTIQDYIQNWGMTWDIEKHKETTKKIESQKKE
ncbi:MAG TPA: DUF6624 domain-containing protein [Flavobacteriaceae bacterium]|nr:DUF6624 domain-containing protein [Flavobacteriaceae bacterium]